MLTAAPGSRRLFRWSARRPVGRGVAGLAAAIFLLAPPAAAEQAQDFITVGLLTSLTAHSGEDHQPAVGGEATYVHYLDPIRDFGLGGFFQGQAEAAKHGRFALGPQINYYLFGLEVGAYSESSSPGYATTWGVHVAPFLSLGVVTAAFRVGVPLGTPDVGKLYGTEFGWVFTFKVPIPVGGDIIGNILR